MEAVSAEQRGGRNTEVTEFLGSALLARREALRRWERVEELASRAARTTGGMAVSSGACKGPQETWDLLAEEKTRLRRAQAEAVRQEALVESFLARLPDPRWREVLRLRYLSGKSLAEAASFMSYSYSSARRLSAGAMRAAAALWEREGARHGAS